MVVRARARRRGVRRGRHGAVPRGRDPLLAAQTAACLEVVHAILGIARSPVLVTAMQVSSRLMVVWGVLYVSPSRTAVLAFGEVGGVQLGLGVPSLLLCWGITGWCGTPSTFGSGDRPARHRVGQVRILPRAVPARRLQRLVRDAGSSTWSSRARSPSPCGVNIALHFPSIQVMFFLGYVPGFPMLYQYMLKQRKSALAPAKPKKA